jgi:hypothetical protein
MLKRKVLAAAVPLILIGGTGAAEASVPAAALADGAHRGRRAGPRSVRALTYVTEPLPTRARDRMGLAAHSGGEQEAMADLWRYQAAQSQIEDEMARGPRKHHRLPRWIGHVPTLVLLTDFCLLLYFLAGITDVDWASPLSVNLAFAVLLTTTVSYAFLAFVGYCLRGYKDHSRAIVPGDLASACARARGYVTGLPSARRAGPRSTATIGRRASLLSALTVGCAGPRSSWPMARRAPGRSGHRIVQPGWTG